MQMSAFFDNIGHISWLCVCVCVCVRHWQGKSDRTVGELQGGKKSQSEKISSLGYEGADTDSWASELLSVFYNSRAILSCQTRTLWDRPLWSAVQVGGHCFYKERGLMGRLTFCFNLKRLCSFFSLNLCLPFFIRWAPISSRRASLPWRGWAWRTRPRPTSNLHLTPRINASRASMLEEDRTCESDIQVQLF